MVTLSTMHPQGRLPEDRPIEGAPMPAWLAAVVSPRAALPRLLDEECEPVALLYTALAGITLLLAGASEKELSSSVRIGYMVFFCVILGPIAGWTALYLLSFLLTWTGEWLGGRGLSDPVRGAVGYASLPLVPAGCVVLALGEWAGAGWFYLPAAMYAVYVLLVGVAAAHRFSRARAAAALALSLILIAAPTALTILLPAWILVHVM